MNPFLTRAHGAPWVIPVSVLSFVLGFMLILAWLPPTGGSRPGSRDEDLNNRINSAQVNQELRDAYLRSTQEVKKVREEKTKLENAMGDQTRQTKVLNDNLQETKLFAGLTEVEGPGITISLKDSERIRNQPIESMAIHDVDVMRVVNELWACGAEAIAIGNQRVVGRTTIRCVGPTIQIDGMPVASPVRIRAIGDPATLIGGLNLPGGIMDEIRQTGDPSMITIEKVERHHLPAYSGTTASKVMKVTGEAP